MSDFEKRHVTKKFSNKEYRKWFLENSLPRFYNPFVHAGFNLGTLLIVILFHANAVSHVDQWSYFTIFVMLFVGNLVVNLIHQYPLHKRLKFWSFPYDAHTVQHHRYYTSENILMQDIRELFVVMFPWFVVLGFALIVQPLFYYSAQYFIGDDLAHVFCASAAGYFLLYEFVHTSNHLPLSHPVFLLPGLKAMREHHLIHHNPKLMGNYNMGIVFPFFDYVLGTKWKKDQPVPKETNDDHFNNMESFSSK